jgi:hypothetical protein
MGQKFFPGTQAPPAGDQIYWPSPNDRSRFDEASGQWIPTGPYREI